MSRPLLLALGVAFLSPPAVAGPIDYGPGTGSASYSTVLLVGDSAGGSAQAIGYPPGPPAPRSVGAADVLNGVTASAAASLVPVAMTPTAMQFDLLATGNYAVPAGLARASASATSAASFSQAFTLTAPQQVTIAYTIGTGIVTGPSGTANSHQGYDLRTSPGMVLLSAYDTILVGTNNILSSPAPVAVPSLANPLVLNLPAGSYVLSGRADGTASGTSPTGSYTSSLSVRLSVPAAMAAVPEPGTLAVAAGLAGLAAVRRRRG